MFQIKYIWIIFVLSYHTCICQTFLTSLYLTFSNSPTLHLISASLISIFVMQSIATSAVRSLFCVFFEFISRICASSLVRNTLNMCLALSGLEISPFALALHLASLFLPSEIVFKVYWVPHVLKLSNISCCPTRCLFERFWIRGATHHCRSHPGSWQIEPHVWQRSQQSHTGLHIVTGHSPKLSNVWWHLISWQCAKQWIKMTDLFISLLTFLARDFIAIAPSNVIPTNLLASIQLTPYQDILDVFKQSICCLTLPAFINANKAFLYFIIVGTVPCW